MPTNSFKNIYGVKRITLKKKVHCYCRLGNDWYTNQLTISFNPGSSIPDYVFIDDEIERQCEKQDLLIEEVIKCITTIVINHCPDATDIHVSSYIDDSVPKNMQVLVEGGTFEA